MLNGFTDEETLLLGEITKGYSVISDKDKRVYFKHFSISDHFNINEFGRFAYEDAIMSGIECQNKLLEKAKEYGGWSDKEEKTIKDLTAIIKKVKGNAKSAKDPVIKQVLEKELKNLQGELEHLNKKRNSIIMYSAESLVHNKKVVKMMESCLFEDNNFKKKINIKENENLIPLVAERIISMYNQDIMLRVSYEEIFFEAFIYQKDNPIILFSDCFRNLTVFQHRILSYASALLTKLQNSPNVPDNILKDPVALYSYKPPDDDSEEKEEPKSLKEVARKFKEGETIPIQELA